MQRGDVVRVELPWPKGKAGREQAETGPAVVVQSNQASVNPLHSCHCPIDKQPVGIAFRWVFSGASYAENGLTSDSVVLTHQMRALDTTRIEIAIGVLSDADLKRLEDELRSLLGL